MLKKRLHDVLVRLNPNIPGNAYEDSFRRLSHLEGDSLETRNREFHFMAAKGVAVEYRDYGGVDRGVQVNEFNL